MDEQKQAKVKKKFALMHKASKVRDLFNSIIDYTIEKVKTKDSPTDRNKLN